MPRIERLAKEAAEGLGGGRQRAVAPVHDVPGAGDRKALHGQDAQVREVGLRERMAREDREAQPAGDRLLDRLVGADRHAMREARARPREVLVHGEARAGARLAQQEPLRGELRERRLPRGRREAARRDHHQRIVEEALRLDGPALGRRAHDVQVVAAVAQPGEHALPVLDVELDLDPLAGLEAPRRPGQDRQAVGVEQRGEDVGALARARRRRPPGIGLAPR